MLNNLIHIYIFITPPGLRRVGSFGARYVWICPLVPVPPKWSDLLGLKTNKRIRQLLVGYSSLLVTVTSDTIK